MTGDWVTDAKNGTLKAISQIAKLPGPVSFFHCPSSLLLPPPIAFEDWPMVALAAAGVQA